MKWDAISRNGAAHRLGNVQLAAAKASPASAVPRGKFAGHAIYQSLQTRHLAVIDITQLEF